MTYLAKPLGRTILPVSLLCAVLQAGCAHQTQVHSSALVPASQTARAPASRAVPPLQQAAYHPGTPEQAAVVSVAEKELTVEALIERVLARNPSLAEMAAAAQAAAARYPQAASLDDPMFGASLAPASVGSSAVDFGYRLEAFQRYPFPGKLGLRGENALAEASAAGYDVEDMRLQLVENATTAFYDYYLVERALAVNAEALRLLKEFRDNAETRYRTGLVPQQDVLQADVEIGRQQERRLSLERMRQVVRARLNALMHQTTSTPLPPPPEELTPAGALPDVGQLQAWAVAQRPDLRALADRIVADRAALALAYKEFYPDFEVMAAYDAFWQEKDLQAQLGVRLNLPVRKSRRYAAVAEAQARIAQRQAEIDRQTDQVHFQVAEAYQLVRESEQAYRLYEATILPAARENVSAAQAAYVTGRIPFLSLLEAERNLIGLRDRSYESLADIHRRRAMLERVLGGPLAMAP